MSIFNQWQSPRIIRARSHHGLRPQHASYGPLAGDGYADIVIKAHALEEYDAYIALHQYISFSSYIDDTGIGVEGDTKEEVVQKAICAGRGFRQVACKLQATINDKFAI
eukprot:9473936-Pyramimonas_sp.AAC.1